nr:unknown [Medicago truncatula]
MGQLQGSPRSPRPVYYGPRFNNYCH